jgi:NADPH:quinone reductase-like Zn-dependent oxidoreductase
MTMRAVVLDRFGDPADVLKVRDVAIPEPGPGQVRVKMIATPVNPSDLLVTRGLYGVLPKLPSTPGFEGVGVVDKVGPGLIGRFVKGKRVCAINSAGGNWAEYAVIPARQARPVPADLPDDQVASFFVNPGSVLAMVKYVLKVPPGETLLQTAAGSALGTMVIRYCKAEGIRTINVVRRREAMDEILTLGGDLVLTTADGPLDPQVLAATHGQGVKYALDAVGGDTGTQVFQSLGDDARMLMYGTLSGEPVRIEPRRMIAGKRVVEGFWLGHWMRRHRIPFLLKFFREIAAHIRSGELATEVGGRFPLEAVAEAAAQAESPGKVGKVLLTL